MDNTVVKKKFNELSANEVYDILKLRNEVFIVEQNCAYGDIDGRDPGSVHIYLLAEDSMAAYCRVLPPGLAFDCAAIGRVVTKMEHRGQGYARKLMKQAISYINGREYSGRIKVSAQAYLKDFYGSLGFKIISDVYLEDGIPHYEMLYEKGD